jgi:hypothetical protein
VHDVIPHFYGLGNAPLDDGDGLNNLRLRVGEVQAIYPTDHPMNVSKKFTEYQVFVTHRANGTAVTKMYERCAVADAFGGAADTSTQTYRADTSASRKRTGPGLGSKVVILCINGESVNPLIVGGIRDPQGDPDDPEAGHHLRRKFNGVDLAINDDGELELTYTGADNADGTLRDDVDEDAVGTTVRISKNGNFEVADADGKNSVLVDHENNRVVVTSDGEVNVTAPKVTLGGADAEEPVVLGNQWQTLMGQMIDLIGQITVATAVGPSSPPLNLPAFQILKAQLAQALSPVSFTK